MKGMKLIFYSILISFFSWWFFVFFSIMLFGFGILDFKYVFLVKFIFVLYMICFMVIFSFLSFMNIESGIKMIFKYFNISFSKFKSVSKFFIFYLDSSVMQFSCLVCKNFKYLLVCFVIIFFMWLLFMDMLFNNDFNFFVFVKKVFFLIYELYGFSWMFEICGSIYKSTLGSVEGSSMIYVFKEMWSGSVIYMFDTQKYKTVLKKSSYDYLKLFSFIYDYNCWVWEVKFLFVMLVFILFFLFVLLIIKSMMNSHCVYDNVWDSPKYKMFCWIEWVIGIFLISLVYIYFMRSVLFLLDSCTNWFSTSIYFVFYVISDVVGFMVLGFYMLHVDSDVFYGINGKECKEVGIVSYCVVFLWIFVLHMLDFSCYGYGLSCFFMVLVYGNKFLTDVFLDMSECKEDGDKPFLNYYTPGYCVSFLYVCLVAMAITHYIFVNDEKAVEWFSEYVGNFLTDLGVWGMYNLSLMTFKDFLLFFLFFSIYALKCIFFVYKEEGKNSALLELKYLFKSYPVMFFIIPHYIMAVLLSMGYSGTYGHFYLVLFAFLFLFMFLFKVIFLYKIMGLKQEYLLGEGMSMLYLKYFFKISNFMKCFGNIFVFDLFPLVFCFLLFVFWIIGYLGCLMLKEIFLNLNIFNNYGKVWFDLDCLDVITDMFFSSFSCFSLIYISCLPYNKYFSSCLCYIFPESSIFLFFSTNMVFGCPLFAFVYFVLYKSSFMFSFFCFCMFCNVWVLCLFIFVLFYIVYLNFDKFVFNFFCLNKDIDLFGYDFFYWYSWFLIFICFSLVFCVWFSFCMISYGIIEVNIFSDCFEEIFSSFVFSFLTK